MKYQFFLFIGFVILSILNSCKDKNEKKLSGVESLNKIEVKAKNNTTVLLPYFGASSAGFPNEHITGIESWERLNTRIKKENGGIGLSFRRSFGKGCRLVFHHLNMAADIGKCQISVGELKPDFNNSDSENYDIIRDFVLTIPEYRTVYLVYHHEPEKKIKEGRYTADQFTSGFENFFRAVVSVQNRRPNVHPCFCIMSWTFNPKSGRNPEDYHPIGLSIEEQRKTIAGVDGYCNDPSESAASKFDPIFDKMGPNADENNKNWGFKRFGIFETSAHGDRSEWVIDLVDWAKNRKGIELVSWFNSSVGPNAGPKGWYLGSWEYNQINNQFSVRDDDKSLQSFASAIKPSS